ncbi:MAG: hypothetical protein JWN50_71 [Parcubacteria group bacterium]|nr:hypothetical protein [Parcubacteria group bacterium]
MKIKIWLIALGILAIALGTLGYRSMEIPAARSHVATIEDILKLPNIQPDDVWSDDWVEYTARDKTFSFYHPSGWVIRDVLDGSTKIFDAAYENERMFVYETSKSAEEDVRLLVSAQPLILDGHSGYWGTVPASANSPYIGPLQAFVVNTKTGSLRIIFNNNEEAGMTYTQKAMLQSLKVLN